MTPFARRSLAGALDGLRHESTEMILRACILGLATLITTAHAGDAPTHPCEGEVPGSYDLLVCKGPCSFTSADNVLVRGFVVLEADEFEVSEVIEPIRQQFDYGYAWAGNPRGCFVLETLERNRTYAGIIPLGFSRWSWRNSELRFELYASPDAWYNTQLNVTADGFKGRGVSSGVGAAAPPGWLPDLVIGRRTGPPDRMKCIQAAVARLRK